MTYSVADRYGNVTTDDFVLTIDGGTGPTITIPPADRTYSTATGSLAESFQLSTATGAGPFTYALTGLGGESPANAMPDGNFDSGINDRRVTVGRRVIRHLSVDLHRHRQQRLIHCGAF